MSDAEIPRGWRRWFGMPSRSKARVAQDVDDEIAFHLAMREQELRAGGASASEATRLAHARLGDARAHIALVRSAQRAEQRRRRRRWWADLNQDLTHATRRLTREPGFAAVVVATLALGIGTTLAVASLLDRVLVSPLPYRGAERLWVVDMQSRDGSLRTSATKASVEAWRSGVPSFERIETVNATSVLVSQDGVNRMRPVGLVSPGLLQHLNVPAVVGRALAPTDAQPDATPVAMLAWSVWRRTYHSDPSVIGQPLTLGDRTYTIVGVMPRQFDLSHFAMMSRPDVWLPMAESSDRSMLQAIGIARGNVDKARLQAELDAAHARMAQGTAGASLVPTVTPLLDRAGARTKDTLRLMLAAALLVLVIAGVNVANLLIARGASRDREWAIRRAVGASRGRVVRQLTTESMVLTGLGAMAGLAVARGLIAVAVAVRPPDMAAVDDVQLDARMAAMTVVLTLLVGLLFGLAPSWLTTARQATLLHAGQRAIGTGRAGSRLRRGLIFVELGLSAALAVAAMLLLRSAQALQSLPLGYDVDPIVTAYIQRAPGTAPERSIRGMMAPAIDRIRGLPGVRAVSLAEGMPGSFGGCLCSPSVEGGPLALPEAGGFLLTQYVDSTFVSTSGLTILRGRALAADSAAREVLITDALARRLWPGQDAIGRRFRMDNEAPLRTVVGIVGVQRSPEGWVPADSQQVILTESVSNEPSLVVRVDGSTQDAVRAITRVMQEEAPGLQVFDLRPLAQSVAEARAPQHFTRWLITAFAVLALALAAIGLYGVMAFGVVQRYREIGVRMALGARRSTIARLILGEGLRLCVAAVVAGALGSLALTQLLRGMLVNVSRWDPWAYAGAALAMLMVATAALWLPTRRATQIDPATAVLAD